MIGHSHFIYLAGIIITATYYIFSEELPDTIKAP